MEQIRLLKQYFGHEAFRDGQKPLIDALLAGREGNSKENPEVDG